METSTGPRRTRTRDLRRGVSCAFLTAEPGLCRRDAPTGGRGGSDPRRQEKKVPDGAR